MRSTSILAFILLLFFVAVKSFADVYVNLPDTTGYPSDTLNIPIYVSDLTGLEVYSYQCKIIFDSKIVRAIGVDSTGTSTQQWGTTTINLTKPGEILLGNYGVGPLHGEGVLIYVRFRIVGQSDDSTFLQFHDFEFNAGEPVAINTNGSIHILHPPITVLFNSNIGDDLIVLIDGIERKLPFDTTWEHGSTHQIGTISPQYQSSAARFVFESWSDGGDTTHWVTAVTDTAFTVQMKQQYLLTVNSEWGTVTGAGWYDKGTPATFSVDAAVPISDTSRYAFAKWTGQGNSSYSGPNRMVKITMNDPVTETAEWNIQYILEINSHYGNPIGAGWHDQGDTITIGIDSLVSPVEGTRYLFDSWIGKGQDSYSGRERIALVVMSQPVHQQVVWKTEHYLWLKSDPEGIIDFDQSGWYLKNQTVITDTAEQLLNLPDLICHFQRWSIDGQPVAGNPTRILMDTSHTAESLYHIDSVRVTITSNIGTGISIYVDHIKHSVPYSEFWAFQSAHLVGVDTLQFSVGMKDRYRFESWSDNEQQSHIVQADTVLKMNLLLSAEHFLFIDTHPSGLIDFIESDWYEHGDTVHISQVPEQIIVQQDTFDFKGWHLDNTPLSGNPINVIMDQYHSVIALYEDLYFIKGRVTDRRGFPLPAIEMILSGTLQDTLTILSNKEYCFNFLIKGDYRITPLFEGFRFVPVYREYTSLQSSSSDQNFLAYDTLKPEIRLLYPSGGENLKATTTDTIVWQAEDNVGIESIVIGLSLDNGNIWQIIAVLDSADDSHYIWTIPDTASSQCKIRITVIDYDGNQASDMCGSVFSIQNTSAITENPGNNLPMKFEVFQNYPNPFNSATNLRFQLPEDSHLTVRIFNIKGQELIVLFDGKLNSGYHLIKWDGKDQHGSLVGTGIYFYQIEALNKVITRRLLYIR